MNDLTAAIITIMLVGLIFFIVIEANKVTSDQLQKCIDACNNYSMTYVSHAKYQEHKNIISCVCENENYKLFEKKIKVGGT